MKFRLIFKSRQALVNYQKKRIANHLDFIQKHAGFYKSYIDITLSKLPVINKEILMENFDQLNTKGIKKEEAIQMAIKAEKERDFAPQINNVTIGLSSGTSGNKSIFLASEQDRVKYVSAIFVKVLFPLKHFKTKVALFFRANSNLYESVGSMLIDFKYFDLTDDLDVQIPNLNSFNPHIIVAPPTLLNILTEKQEHGTLCIKPDKIISVAEVLEEDIKVRIENVFSQKVHQLYQCTEGFLASTCEYGNLHLHEDFIHFEKKWLDSTKKRFHPIITDFSRTTQAMIRYELNDILHIGNKCKCGSIFTMIEKIEGRSDDIFKFISKVKKGIVVFPDQIRNAIIITSNKVLNYRIVQIDNSNISVALKLKEGVNRLQEKEKIFIAIYQLLKSKGVKEISLNEVIWKEPKYNMKFRRIVNENNLL